MSVLRQPTHQNRFAWVTLAYAAISVAYTWPLVVNLGRAIAGDEIDPISQAWVIWWNSHHLPFSAGWFGPGIFWPSSGTITFQDVMLGVYPVTAVLDVLGIGPLPAYNVLFIASHCLAALAAFVLCRHVVGDDGAAFAGGAFFGFGLYRLAQFSHLNILLSFLLPLAVYFVIRFAETSRARDAAGAAVCMAVQGMTAGYWFVYGSLFIGFAAAFFVRNWRQLLRLATVSLLGVLLVTPWLLAYRGVHDRYDLNRALDEVMRLSAPVEALWRVSRHSRLWSTLLGWDVGEAQFFPGVVVVAVVLASLAGWRRAARVPRSRVSILLFLLAVGCLPFGVVALVAPDSYGLGGISIGLNRPNRPFGLACWLATGALLASATVRGWWATRSATGFFVLSALASWLLALGPSPTAAGVRFWYASPYSWLVSWPGFDSVRVPARFWIITTLCLAVIVSAALVTIAGRLPWKVRGALGWATAVLILFESWPAMPLAPRPASAPGFAALTRVDAVLELPACDPAQDVAAMFRSTEHGVPTVNGYSGYSPYWYSLLCRSQKARDGTALRVLSERGTLGILLNRRESNYGGYASMLRGLGAPLTAGDATWDLYVLERTTPDAGRLTMAGSVGEPRVITVPGVRDVPVSARGTFETELLPPAGTRWTDVLVKLAAGCDVHGLRLAGGVAPPVVEISEGWPSQDTPWWEGPVLAEALRSNLVLGRGVEIDIPLPRRRTDALTVSLFSDVQHGWSLKSVRVWADDCR